MNKNTILAILLILIAVTIFNSQTYNKFFYEKIYPRKPFIEKNNSNNQKSQQQPQIANNSELKKDTTNYSQLSQKIDTTKVSNDTTKSDTVWIETDKIIIGIRERGALIASVKIKNYKYSQDKNSRKQGDLIDILPVSNSAGSQLLIQGENYDNKNFICNENLKNISINGNEEKQITFTCNTDNEITTKTYVFKNGTYKVGLNVGKNTLGGKKIEIGWKGGIEESEQSKQLQQDIRTVHYSDGKTVQHLQKKKGETESITGNYKWVGVTSKYFFVSIVNNDTKDADADITVESFSQKNENINKKDNIINYSIDYSITADSNIQKFWFYLGPNSYNELKSYKIGFQKIMFPVLGWSKYIFFADKWFPSIAEAVLWVLLALFHLVKDYGIAILLLTFITKLVTYPMMYSSMKSMNKMKGIQPKITAMREKYKNNPKKMNEELMNLYRKEGINPLNPGCLPMFLQMPIFIALFVVLRKAIELRGAETVFIPWIHDLSKPEVLVHLPWNIPMYGSNLALLPIIMAVLTYFQNKMTIKDPNQKAMIYFMPIFMLALFNNFASGLVLYWTFSSAFAIIQQIITDKQMAKTKK